MSAPVNAPTMVSVIPRRSPHPSARSVNRCRHSATAAVTLTSVCSTIAAPIRVDEALTTIRTEGVDGLAPA
jgi:hypothetical protein